MLVGGEPWNGSVRSVRTGFVAGLSLAGLLVLVSTPGPATAQGEGRATVLGRVVEVDSERPVVGASIRLEGADRVTGSDENGRFTFEDVPLGRYALTAEHLSYESVVDSLFLGAPATYDVVIRIAAEAIELAGIDVRVRSVPNVLADVRARQERMEDLGLGDIFDRGEIDESGAYRLSHLLGQLPGARLQPIPGRVGASRLMISRNDCTPSYYLDGLQVPSMGESVDDFVPLDDIETVEVYRRISMIPSEFADERARQCGVVAIWTRRGGSDGEPFGWHRLITVVGFLGIVFLSTSLWL